MARCMKCMEEYSDKRKACPNCNTLSGARRVKEYHLPTNTLLIGRYTVGMAVNENSVNIKYICYDNVRKVKVFIYEFFPVSLVIRNSDNLVAFISEAKGNKFAESLKAYVEEVEKIEGSLHMPGIENILDYFIENNTCYVVCEYTNYVTLSSYIKKNRKRETDGKTKLQIVYRLLYALKMLHSVNVIHGNISPEHIVITDDNDAMFVDMGVGCFVNSTGIAVYSPCYSPPEASGDNVCLNTASDVYSISAVCYKLLSGVTPYSANERLKGKKLISLNKLGINVKKSMDNAILNALNIDAENRYVDADEFFKAIKDRNTVRIYDEDEGRRGIVSVVLICCAAVAILGITGSFIVSSVLNNSNKIEVISDTSTTETTTAGTITTETTSVLTQTTIAQTTATQTATETTFETVTKKYNRDTNASGQAVR